MLLNQKVFSQLLYSYVLVHTVLLKLREDVHR